MTDENQKEEDVSISRKPKSENIELSAGPVTFKIPEQEYKNAAPAALGCASLLITQGFPEAILQSHPYDEVGFAIFLLGTITSTCLAIFRKGDKNG